MEERESGLTSQPLEAGAWELVLGCDGCLSASGLDVGLFSESTCSTRHVRASPCAFRLYMLRCAAAGFGSCDSQPGQTQQMAPLACLVAGV